MCVCVCVCVCVLIACVWPLICVLCSFSICEYFMKVSEVCIISLHVLSVYACFYCSYNAHACVLWGTRLECSHLIKYLGEGTIGEGRREVMRRQDGPLVI